jgi:hypothetical protein
VNVKALFAAAIMAMIAVGAPATASAAPERSSTAIQVDEKSKAPVRVGKSGTVSTKVIYDVGCWTTFRPPSPGGGPLTHYYANCLNQWVTVCPAVDLPSGRTIYYDTAWTLAPYPGVANETNTAVWYYGSTYPNGMYTTVYC